MTVKYPTLAEMVAQDRVTKTLSDIEGARVRYMAAQYLFDHHQSDDDLIAVKILLNANLINHEFETRGFSIVLETLLGQR